MKKEQLAEKVKQMRDAQKDYFKNRTRSALELSKKLEKELDQVISDILSYKDAQKKLF